MDRRRTYKNPPIHEAVCGIHFAPGTDWDPTYPSLLYARVRDKYSGKSREQKLVNIEPNPADTQGKGAAGMTVNEITRLQFVTPDQKQVFGVYPDDLSVSVLRPYPGWEVFRPAIADALAAYSDIAKPAGVRRIGIRYINIIEFPGSLSDLLGCFTNPPTRLPIAESQITNFTSRFEYLYNDEPIRASVTTARIVGAERKMSALFDIDLALDWAAEPLPLEQTMTRVDELRRRERLIFESLITAQARAIFDA